MSSSHSNSHRSRDKIYNIVYHICQFQPFKNPGMGYHTIGFLIIDPRHNPRLVLSLSTVIQHCLSYEQFVFGPSASPGTLPASPRKPYKTMDMIPVVSFHIRENTLFGSSIQYNIKSKSYSKIMNMHALLLRLCTNILSFPCLN